MIPGEMISNNPTITLNQGKDKIEVKVANLGDRPIQVGSHFHFFEVNKALWFKRILGFGKRLNIPSGTAVRFEPGDEKTIELIEFSGKKQLIGFNNLVDGIATVDNLSAALAKVKYFGFANQGDVNEF